MHVDGPNHEKRQAENLQYNMPNNEEDDTGNIRKINNSTINCAPIGFHAYDLGFELKSGLINAKYHIDLMY